MRVRVAIAAAIVSSSMPMRALARSQPPCRPHGTAGHADFSTKGRIGHGAFGVVPSGCSRAPVAVGPEMLYMAARATTGPVPAGRRARRDPAAAVPCGAVRHAGRRDDRTLRFGGSRTARRKARSSSAEARASTPLRTSSSRRSSRWDGSRTCASRSPSASGFRRDCAIGPRSESGPYLSDEAPAGCPSPARSTGAATPSRAPRTACGRSSSAARRRPARRRNARSGR